MTECWCTDAWVELDPYCHEDHCPAYTECPQWEGLCGGCDSCILAQITYNNPDFCREASLQWWYRNAQAMNA